MRLTQEQKDAVLANARECGIADAKLARVGDGWLVIGHDNEVPGRWVAKAVAKVEDLDGTLRVWWAGGYFFNKLRRDALAEAAAQIAPAGATIDEGQHDVHTTTAADLDQGRARR